jgi:hypothetical protein
MKTCHDCEVEEGNIHHLGCDMERCPFCGGQLISCDCCYKQIGIDVSEGTWAYEHGLTVQQEEQWLKFLELKGRVPYIVFPNMCMRCGQLWPEMFHVDNDRWWAAVPIAKRGGILCMDCFVEIENLIARAKA